MDPEVLSNTIMEISKGEKIKIIKAHRKKSFFIKHYRKKKKQLGWELWCPLAGSSCFADAMVWMLWSEKLSLLEIHIEILIPKCDGIGSWELWEVLVMVAEIS